jgi:hypothetical protein
MWLDAIRDVISATGKEGETYRDILAHLASNHSILVGDYQHLSSNSNTNPWYSNPMLSSALDELIR